METSNAKRPFYRNAEDTIADVGISQRQLGYWRKQGLFKPELGSKTKYFTEADTDHLRFLKDLIVGLGLPISTVQELIATASYFYDENSIFSMPPTSQTFIDVRRAELVYPPDALNKLIAEDLGAAQAWKLRGLLKTILVLVLRREASANRDVYEAHLKTIHDLVEHADLLARIRQNDDESLYFWPKRHEDPELTEDIGTQLHDEQNSVLAEVHRARWQRKRRDVVKAKQA